MLITKSNNKMLTGKSLLGIIFIISGVFSYNELSAQANPDKDLTWGELSKKISDRNLIVDKVNTKLEVAAIDSIRMKYELDEEGDMSIADELYDGIWNNRFIKAYSDVVIPDSFQINLSNFVMPVEGKITSPFGPRRRRFHYGTDLKLQKGDTVYAAFDGKVRIRQFERRGYGYYLVLRHPNGLETVYGHLSRFLVQEGEAVAAGQPIALGGSTGRSTGSHLHFECRFLGQAIDPADIIDFDNFCTFDDHYVYHKSNVNAVSIHNSNYTKYASYDKTVTYHRIQDGDTLSKIAKKYGVSVNQICRLNGLQPTSLLKVGKVLRCS